MRVAVPSLEIQPCVWRVRSHEHVLREFRISRVAESDFGSEEEGGELEEGCSQCSKHGPAGPGRAAQWACPHLLRVFPTFWLLFLPWHESQRKQVASVCGPIGDTPGFSPSYHLSLCRGVSCPYLLLPKRDLRDCDLRMLC